MKNEKGFALIGVIIALALLGIISVAFLGALGTGSKALSIADERATAESLAESQVENVKNQPYTISYTAQVPAEYADAGYSATVDIESLEDGNIQKIIVTIKHHDKVIITLEDYKVNR